MTWDPGRYLQFEGQRMRPALDLLARVPLMAPGSIIDLGCGAGNVTRMLAERWTDAPIVGIDTSAAMLEQARASNAHTERVSFVLADIAAWQGADPVSLVYSNAALQWLDDHATLLPQLAAQVSAGGTLAVQMPHNHHAPSHATSLDLARSAEWKRKLGGVVRAAPVADPADYFRWLTPHVRSLDIWTTEYLHVLAPQQGPDHPVAAFTRGTWLVPWLAALASDDQTRFMEQYSVRLSAAYPPEADGRTLFPFRRLFILANR